ncbi:hypothetical protein QUW02_05925 [Bacteroides eggerthii]|uniref:Uncharacterized protein n=1 Tax=Bacteroides eggerthii TaxID=28111 RepID=A0ABT7U4L1_9BACE|nr:hypothetical protein [Bacteroides eggerthii]
MVQAHPEAQKPSDFSGGFFVITNYPDRKAIEFRALQSPFFIENASLSPEKSLKRIFFEEKSKKYQILFGG